MYLLTFNKLIVLTSDPTNFKQPTNIPFFQLWSNWAHDLHFICIFSSNKLNALTQRTCFHFDTRSSLTSSRMRTPLYMMTLLSFVIRMFLYNPWALLNKTQKAYTKITLCTKEFIHEKDDWVCDQCLNLSFKEIIWSVYLLFLLPKPFS